MASLDSIRKEVLDLITLNEKIQSALLDGDSLNTDETEIVRLCASELLNITVPVNAVCSNGTAPIAGKRKR